jgi:hypothetical protein
VLTGESRNFRQPPELVERVERWKREEKIRKGNEERSRHYSIYSANGQAVPSTKTVLVVSQFRRLGRAREAQGG